MKIINPDHDTERTKAGREASLVEYLQRLQIEVGEPQDLPHHYVTWSLEQKEKYRDCLERIQQARTGLKVLKKEHALFVMLRDAGFPSFGGLPLELKLLVWACAASEWDHSRVHIVNLNRDSLKSNQPIPNLPHVCHDSRAQFLAVLGGEFAFETYINLDKDIFYLSDAINAPVMDLRQNSLFIQFVNHPQSSKIQRLALGQQVFCLATWNELESIAEVLDSLLELCVVFDDTRSAEQMSLDVHSSMIYFAAQQQRKRPFIGYVRSSASFVRSRLQAEGFSLPRINYVRMENF